MKIDVQKIEHGTLYCEAGLPVRRMTNRLPYCAKRARWFVNGIALCGGCKRRVMEG